MARFAETAAVGVDLVCVQVRRCAAEEPDHRHRWLLRPRRKRPCRRAADQRDDLAAVAHSMTSSARTRNDSGIVSPIAFAVLLLTISSNLVACSTGRSAGLAPFRILSPFRSMKRLWYGLPMQAFAIQCKWHAAAIQHPAKLCRWLLRCPDDQQQNCRPTLPLVRGKRRTLQCV